MAQASLIKWLYFSGAHDETGEPVSSGFAYFYVPHSTSTQTTVYADDAGATPITQPVPLDAAGRAEVFITQNCEIKVLDAAGAEKRLTVNAESVTAKLVYCTYSESPTTLDIALAAIEAALDANAPDPPVDSAGEETISSASPVFNFEETKQLNVLRATYGGAVGALTINWTLPGTTKYARYRIVIQTGASTTATSTVFPASIKTSSPPTTLTAETWYTAEFQAISTSSLCQVTPWISGSGNYW